MIPKEDMFSDIEIINNKLKNIVKPQSKLTHNIYKQIIDNGKRFRPLLVLYSSLSLKPLRYLIEESAVLLGCIVELIHSASLLHDDIIDEASTRRNVRTAHSMYGINSAILGGDYLYSLAFNMVLDFDARIAKKISNAAYLLSEGEIEEIENVFNHNISIDKYLDIIYKKTAVLIEASSAVGAILADDVFYDNFCEFGKNVGYAFQIKDDCLDFDATKEDIGKNVGYDLKEGKITLPTIYAIEKSASLINMIEDYFNTKDDYLLDSICEIIKNNGVAPAINKAKWFSQMAKQSISNLRYSQYKNYLLDICDYAVKRKS